MVQTLPSNVNQDDQRSCEVDRPLKDVSAETRSVNGSSGGKRFFVQISGDRSLSAKTGRSIVAVRRVRFVKKQIDPYDAKHDRRHDLQIRN